MQNELKPLWQGVLIPGFTTDGETRQWRNPPKHWVPQHAICHAPQNIPHTPNRLLQGTHFPVDGNPPNGSLRVPMCWRPPKGSRPRVNPLFEHASKEPLFEQLRGPGLMLVHIYQPRLINKGVFPSKSDDSPLNAGRSTPPNSKLQVDSYGVKIQGWFICFNQRCQDLEGFGPMSHICFENIPCL